MLKCSPSLPPMSTIIFKDWDLRVLVGEASVSVLGILFWGHHNDILAPTQKSHLSNRCFLHLSLKRQVPDTFFCIPVLRQCALLISIKICFIAFDLSANETSFFWIIKILSDDVRTNFSWCNFFLSFFFNFIIVFYQGFNLHTWILNTLKKITLLWFIHQFVVSVCWFVLTV